MSTEDGTTETVSNTRVVFNDKERSSNPDLVEHFYLHFPGL